MSIIGVPGEAQIVALSPPIFRSVCVKCGLWRRILPWQFSAGDGVSWGPICQNCALPLITELLRSRLPSRFSEVQFAEVLLNIGVCQKECELLFADFQSEGAIEKSSGGFCWSVEIQHKTQTGNRQEKSAEAEMNSEFQSEDMSEAREDRVAYCPRARERVLLLSSVCFWKGNREACGGCLFDTERIKAKLLWLLADILNKKARAVATDISEIGTVEFSAVNESNPTMCLKTGEVK